MNIKHSIIWCTLRPLVDIFLKIKFGYTSKKLKKSELPENYLVLSNHATDFDPLFVGVSFKRPMHYVASEHISRWKIAYPLLKFAFAPIIRKKGMGAAHAIIDILRKLKHGHNVCMFAEGVRTWDGVTCPIAPTTGQLVKKAGCGLVTYKLVGGYFLSPGWAKTLRRGYAHGEAVNIYTKEQLADMSIDEINEAICRDLYEDAYARQLESPKVYKGKRLAEGIENLIFICPECNAHESITSNDSTAICKSCGMTLTFDKYGMISGTRYNTVRELYKWQKDAVELLAKRGESFKMDNAVLTLIENEAQTVESGAATFGQDGFTMGSIHIPLCEIDAMACHGKHTVVFSSGKSYYELTPDNNTNAVKFVWLYDAIKSLQKSELN